MSRAVVIDASVFIKLFSREDESLVAEAKKLYTAIRRGEIPAFAPTLLLVEVLNVLAIAKKFNEEDATSALRELRDSGITFVTLNIGEIGEIIALRYRHKLTAYDALYLHLAINLDCKLVTEDRKLLKVKKHCLGLKSCLQRL